MPAHLLSDLHLDAAHPELTAIFRRFLAERATKLPALYLLGDVFDVWIGDDDDAALVDEIARALHAVADAGTKVHFMHGNRDFLLGDAFAARAGMTLLPDPTVVTLGGVPTLLSHGDRYCTGDLEYQAFRRQSRNPAWQQAVLSRPLDERRALARQARHESATSQQARLMAGEGLADVVDADVAADLERHGVRRIIHGHTHRPAEHALMLSDGSAAERIVLADWRTNGEALEIRPDGSFVRHVLTPDRPAA